MDRPKTAEAHAPELRAAGGVAKIKRAGWVSLLPGAEREPWQSAAFRVQGLSPHERKTGDGREGNQPPQRRPRDRASVFHESKALLERKVFCRTLPCRALLEEHGGSERFSPRQRARRPRSQSRRDLRQLALLGESECPYSTRTVLRLERFNPPTMTS